MDQNAPKEAAEGEDSFVGGLHSWEGNRGMRSRSASKEDMVRTPAKAEDTWLQLQRSKDSATAAPDLLVRPSFQFGTVPKLAQLLADEEIAPSDLEGLSDEGNQLGKGGFGEVLKVSWRGTPVAAKLSHTDITQEQKQLFLRCALAVCARS